MGAALAIWTELEAAELRRRARHERDGRASGRLIAMANVLDGMSRAAAARAAGMDRQTLRFHAYGCPQPTSRLVEGLAGEEYITSDEGDITWQVSRFRAQITHG